MNKSPIATASLNTPNPGKRRPEPAPRRAAPPSPKADGRATYRLSILEQEIRRASAQRPRRLAHRARRFGLILAASTVTIILAIALHGLSTNSDSFVLPSKAELASLSVGARVVAIANSQLGYRTNPSNSYCNKFSAYWNAGNVGCPGGETSEEWCADFAAWVWRESGIQFTYGYDPGDINAGAVSFYQWGVANGKWHPAITSYQPAPGDVAVYGLTLGTTPSAAHVAIVTGDTPGQPGPNVINGDGDRTGFSVVETGTSQTQADSNHDSNAPLAGYVGPTWDSPSARSVSRSIPGPGARFRVRTARHAKHWAVVIPTDAWTGDIASAVLSGAIAGLLTAIRGVRLSPIDALRTV